MKSRVLKAVPVQNVTNPVSLPPLHCMLDISLFHDFLSRFFIAHTIGPSSQSFSSTSFKNFPPISDLLSELSKSPFHRYTLLQWRETYRSLFSFPSGVLKCIKMIEFLV